MTKVKLNHIPTFLHLHDFISKPSSFQFQAPCHQSSSWCTFMLTSIPNFITKVHSNLHAMPWPKPHSFTMLCQNSIATLRQYHHHLHNTIHKHIGHPLKRITIYNYPYLLVTIHHERPRVIHKHSSCHNHHDNILTLLNAKKDNWLIQPEQHISPTL